MRQAGIVIAITIAGMLVWSTASADAIDLMYIFRFGRPTLLDSFVLLVLVLSVDYVINALAIGLPGLLLGQVKIGALLQNLLVITLLGQAADRVGAIAAGFLAIPLFFLHSSLPLVLLNLLASGVALYLIAEHYLKSKWRVSSRYAWTFGALSAVLTNPAWFLALYLYAPDKKAVSWLFGGPFGP